MSVPTGSETVRSDGRSYRRVLRALGDRVAGTPGDAQAYARCVAHDDHKPSLSVTWRSDSGRTLVNCQRGCDVREVVAALGLTLSDLYDEPPARPSGAQRVPRTPRAPRPAAQVKRAARPPRDLSADAPLVLVGTFIYTDAAGVRVCELRKFTGGSLGRSFVTAAYDGAGVRVVAKKAPALARRPLYNLPAVVAAQGTVWLCEGEKDADAVADVLAPGEAATTMLFGAISRASSWLPQYSEALIGKCVRVIADRDHAGWVHALTVCEVLGDVAASCEVVEPVEGKDAFDHLTTGHGLGEFVAVTRDELVARIERSTSVTSVTSVTSATSATSATDGVAGGGVVLKFPSGQPLAARRQVLTSTQYVEHEGKLCAVKSTRDAAGNPVDHLRVVLGCSARIIRQTLGGLTGIADADTLAQARLERVEVVATHPDTGQVLTLTVEAREWRSGEWLDSLWPDIEFAHTRAGRGAVTAAVRAVSVEAERLAEHVATGWRELPGHGRAYVHAGGAITAAGLVEDVPTNLAGPLANYRLPAPPSSVDELRAAARHHLGLLSDPALEPRVGVVLAGVACRAVLGAAPFVVALVGNPGAGKTALGIVLVQAFGGSMVHRDARHGVSMADKTGATGVAAGKWLSLAADAPLLMDDFAPDEGALRAAQRMGQMVRSAYNRGTGGRDRGTREGGLREGDMPRTLAVVTAEMLPSAASARGRMLLVPPLWTRDTLPVEELQRLQSSSAADARASFTSALIQWCARQDETALTDRVRGWEAEGAAYLQPKGFGVRTAEHVSRLYAGWRAGLEMMVDAGAWSREDARELMRCTVWPALCAAAAADSDADEERDPARHFLSLVAECLAAQEAHVVAPDGACPTSPLEPTGCGWRPVGEGVMPGGDRIGYVRGDRVYLMPGDALRLAERRARASGHELGLTQPTMSAALAAAGVGLHTTVEDGKVRYTPQVRFGGLKPRAWSLPLSALWPQEDGAGGLGAGPGGHRPDVGPVQPVPSSEGLLTPAPRESDLVGEVMVRLPAPMACVGCGELASHAVDGRPVHATCDVPAPQSTDDPAGRESGAERLSRRAVRGTALEVDEGEVREVLRWAESVSSPLTSEEAASAVERWHAVTGCRWQGPHGTIRALLDGHTRWPGTKEPTPADLGLYTQLRASDAFWTSRSWIVTPGDPALNSSVVGVDVNAQYVASAGSVELGEGNPLHYEAGETLPTNVYKLPGWVRLGSAVAHAPHGLDLSAGMWVPTPLAVYLVRDRAVELDIREALVWEHKRKALGPLARLFREWSMTLKRDDSSAGRAALSMAKTVYTKALTGYLAASDERLTPPLWRRHDWAALVRAQAEANALRALDRLPAGCVPRAKYADAVFLEVAEGADLTSWDRLDEVQPGRWKVMGAAVEAGEFVGARTPEHWRARYAARCGGEG